MWPWVVRFAGVVVAGSLVACGSQFTEGLAGAGGGYAGAGGSGGQSAQGGTGGGYGGSGGVVAQGGTGGESPACAPIAWDAPFPSGGLELLDDFDGANGPLASPWIGETEGFAILSNELVHHAMGGGEFILYDQVLCPDQELEVEVAAIDPGVTALEFYLKASNTADGNALMVSYTTEDMVFAVRASVAGSWSLQGSFPAPPLVAGDRVGARALADGTMIVYVNGAPVGSDTSINWPFHAGGGRVGLGVKAAQGTGGTTFDDLFGR